MPMVGHIAETGQIVAVDFRHGNVPPAKDNKPFIQQCQQSLPEDCTVKALRIDAAGYQTKVILITTIDKSLYPVYNHSLSI